MTDTKISVAFTMDVTFPDKRKFNTYAKDTAPDLKGDARIVAAILQPKQPPAEHGFEIVAQSYFPDEKGNGRVDVSCVIHDADKVVAEARRSYCAEWQQENWHPKSMGEAVFEILVGSGDLPSPDDIGLEITDWAFTFDVDLEVKQQERMAEIADYLFYACDIHMDEDVDRFDVDEIVKRAYTTSDCDDFAAVLSEVTGWKTVRAQWRTAFSGPGHHALVVTDAGYLVDVRGVTTAEELRQRYGNPEGFEIVDHTALPQTLGLDFDHEGRDEAKQRILDVIKMLSYAPFPDVAQKLEKEQVVSENPVPSP